MLGPICITMPNLTKIGRTVAKIWRFNSFYRAMLCIRSTSHGPVSVRLSFLTSLSSTKTAKRRITQTTPHDSPGTLVFWCQRSPRNLTGVTLTGAPNAGGVGQNQRLSTNSQLYLENGTRFLIGPVGSRMCSIEWWHCRWPRVPPNWPIFCILHRHS